MLHKMKLNEDPFERMKNGTKTIEFRLFDKKRQQVKVGDQIEFSKLPNLNEKILVDVVKLYREDSFENLFKELYTDKKEIARKINAMYEIYSPEKEQQYGVLGIKILLVKWNNKIYIKNFKRYWYNKYNYEPHITFENTNKFNEKIELNDKFETIIDSIVVETIGETEKSIIEFEIDL